MKIFTNAIKAVFIVILISVFNQVHAQSGNVLDFDGVNDYVQIPFNSSVSTSTISIEFWAKVNSNNGKYQSLITSGGNSSGYSGFAVYAYPDGKWYLFVSNGGPSIIPIVGSSINYGTWTHIAATYYQDTVRFYINNTLVNSLSINNLAPNASFVTRIGAGNSAGSPTDFFGGEIDELSFSRDPLTPAKIAHDMTSPITSRNDAIVLSYYNFNEGIANGNNTTPPVDTLIDQSAYHANGTLFNFTLNGNTSNWVSLSALPVNLVNFTGTQKDGVNLLQWSTASEQNSNRFEVQRSENGSDFSTVGTVAAAGNSDKLINYQYQDKPLSNASQYYYRLKMVDIDGSTKYSSVILIRNGASAVSLIYPNPATDRITINLSGSTLLNTRALLTDLNGKVLQTISLTQSSTPVNISQYQRGMYVVKFSDGSSVKVVKE